MLAPGSRWRLVLHGLLALALICSGAMAWRLLSALEGKADDLSRYIRVDLWTAQQARDEAGQFLLDLNRQLAGGALDRLELRRMLARVRSSADLVQASPANDAVALLADAAGSAAALQTATDRVAELLAASHAPDGQRAHDQRLVAGIEQALAEPLARLRQLVLDLTHVRIQLQDRDLVNVARLIGFNRWLLLAIMALAMIFIGLLAMEVRAAWQAEARARADQARFQDFAEIASDWLWETDAGLHIAFMSERIEAATGEAAPSWLGRPLIDLLSPDRNRPEHTAHGHAIEQRLQFRDLIVSHGEDPAKRRYLRLSGQALHDWRGAFIGYRGVGADISDEVQREDRIRYLAEHDQLTGLPNRLFFQDQLRGWLASQRHQDQAGTLLALDLDSFKDINDSFGHDVGDRLIEAVAGRLRATLRPDDLVARLGGDEFAIVRRDAVADPTATAQLAERIHQVICQPIKIAGFELAIGTSIGIAHFPADGATVEALMKAADLALYTAKAAGRRRSALFRPEMVERLQWKQRVEMDLRQALRDGSLQLHLQPQVDLADHRLIGAEALVRWDHPELGPIGPGQFVPLAEETGLILPLGNFMLLAACRARLSWRGLPEDTVIAVNVSPAQFTHQDLVEEVSAALVATGLPPGQLELEITEGILMRDAAKAIRTIGQLQAMGVHLSIDDFGTGYSSLSYLQRFRVHKLKIDQSFVRNLELDGDNRSIVRAVVMMSQALGLTTIAEGIETPAQHAILQELGCAQGQGYLYGKPMPAAQFAGYAARFRHATPASAARAGR